MLNTRRTFQIPCQTYFKPGLIFSLVILIFSPHPHMSSSQPPADVSSERRIRPKILRRINDEWGREITGNACVFFAAHAHCHAAGQHAGFCNYATTNNSRSLSDIKHLYWSPIKLIIAWSS